MQGSDLYPWPLLLWLLHFYYDDDDCDDDDDDCDDIDDNARPSQTDVNAK